jgi:hypothetical protein
MGTKIVVVVACMVLASCAAHGSQNREITNESKYGVSYCLSLSYSDSGFASDAKYVAGAYLQNGEFGVDMYEAIRGFVENYRKTPYLSKHGRNLDIMKCLDLFGSEELGHLIEEIANKSIQPTAGASAD